jgi:GAF domain-containing protein
MDVSGFNERLAEAAREMVEETGVGDTLARAVLAATEVIDTCDMAGVSLVRPDGTIETPCATTEDLRRIDELQHELKEGPCYDALRHDDVVTANDVSEDHRWPRWGPRIAREVGVHSSLSYRLFTTGGNLGALNLYARDRHAYTHEHLLEGHAIAAHVAVALAASLRERHLTEAIRSRTVIGQATGILMERFGLSADRAFDVMRRLSSHTNTKVYRVADNIVETRKLPRDDTGR